MALVRTYKNYINGKWVAAKSRKKFASLNPATGRMLCYAPQSDKRDVELAVRAAHQGFKRWSSIPAPHRGAVLLEVARLLKKKKEFLSRLVTKEMGKVIAEARGDVQESIDIFEYMAGEGRRLFGHTTPSELPNKFCATTRMPLGIVGMITPWNFPTAIPSWKLAPALICGNSVVFKPSSDTPMCVFELVKILEEAGVPPGVVNVVAGSGKAVGTPIIQHKKLRGISFTGSRDVGEFVVAHAGLKKVGLELGGKNAIIVMGDADLKLALDGVIFGAFGTTGQRCTAASRVIVHKDVKREFEDMLVRKTERLRVGDGLKPSTDVGPLINQAAVDKTHRYTGVGRKERARLLCGGYPIDKQGFFYKPTIFTNVKPKMRIAQEEIFGPSLSLIKVKNVKEAIKVNNSVEYGLSSAMYTNNIRNAFLAMEQIETGITYINSSTIGSEVHLPFGGMKNTGNGTREAGIEGIHEFSETKTVYVDYSGRLQKAQIDIIKK